MKEKKKSTGRGMSCVVVAAMLGAKLWDCSMLAWADTMEWEGTTQISTSDQYTNIDTSAVSLIVEEVYVEAGGYAQEGQSILKLTDDSYQEALDYYAAAIIYAQNDLTGAQMDYDIAMREAESALELARAEAEQAEFTKEQHLKELEETMEEHGEIMTELEDYIEEVEDGIAAGSYSSGSSSGSYSGSLSNSSSNKNNSAQNKHQGESESESETETEGMPESETEEEIPLDTEEGSESETLPGEDPDGSTDQPGNENIPSEGEGEFPPGDESEMQPGSENEGEIPSTEGTEGETSVGVENQLAALEQQITAAESKVSQLEANVETISAAIEEKNEAYDQTLQKIYQKAGLSTDHFCGAGDIFLVKEVDGTTEGAVDKGNDPETEMIISGGEETSAGVESIDGIKTASADSEETLPEETAVEEKSNVKAASETSTPETKAPETKAAETDAPETKGCETSAPETKAAETSAPETKAAETSAPETSAPETSAPETTVPETAPVETPTSGQETIVEEGQSGEANDSEDLVTESAAEVISEAAEELLIEDHLASSEESSGTTGTSSQGSSGTTGENGQTSDSADGEESQDSESESEKESEETLELLLEKLNGMEKERADLYGQLEAVTKELEVACAELEVLEDQKVALLESNQKETTPETEDAPGDAPGTETEGIPGDGTGMFPGSTDGTGTFPSTDTQQDGLSDMSGAGSTTGSFPSGMSGSFPGSGSISGSSTSTGVVDSAGTASGSISTGGQMTASGSGFSMGGMSSSEDTESLFGDTYDLTSIENLLERTPSSEEEAETLLEELKAAEETVADQYAELTRNEKMTRLEIQYTYDTAVIAGKLAEITYQQEAEELEATLKEAKNNVTKLEEGKARLDGIADGVMTAGYTGSIASVNYEAGDELNSATALYSVYNTDVVTVTLAVSQYEISEFHVGDTVEAEISNYGTLEGTVTEKSPEASEGSSRTSINYEMEVTIENSTGRLSSGLAAAISKEVAEDE